MALDMQDGETLLGSWSVNEQSPGKRTITGKLKVTSRRIVFEAQIPAGGTAMKQLRRMASGSWKAANSVFIDRDQVTKIDSTNGFFSKKLLVTVADGRSCVFNRGFMSVDPILAALGQG